MKPSASKRRSKRTESIDSEENASLASSVSRNNNTPSASSESEADTTDKRSLKKRTSGKKVNDSEGEYSDTEGNKKRKSAKKRLHVDKDTENRDSDSVQHSESEDDIETAKPAKKIKVANTPEKKPKKGKGRPGRPPKQARGRHATVTNGNTAAPDNFDYEVEDIIDNRMKFGKLQYLIRWKGYGAQNDTWERADGLQCPDIIKRYKHRAREERDAESSGDEKTEEYEVNRILEVHFRRDGIREFLVNWKGFSGKDNTWEHESNMKCPELIAQFMRRVEQAKEVTPRELREQRKPTDHYTANMFQVVGRRFSGRSINKPRVNYFYDDQY